MYLQASVVGGALQHGGDAPNKEITSFFTEVARVLAAAVSDPKISADLQFDPSPSVRCPAGDLQVEGSRITLQRDGRRWIQYMNTRGGYWFQWLVASCLEQAGADEVVVGLRWAWSRELVELLEKRLPTGHRRPVWRDDADVVARFGHRFCLVECKVGSGESRKGSIQQVSAVATMGLGRFALPILALPKAPSDKHRQKLEQQWRAVILDLPTLADPGKLLETLNRGWRWRSSLLSG